MSCDEHVEIAASGVPAERSSAGAFVAQVSPELARLIDEALMPPVEEQELLANSLLSHVAENTDESVQAAWDAEIKRRLDDIRSGKAKMVPLEEVRQRMMARLARNDKVEGLWEEAATKNLARSSSVGENRVPPAPDVRDGTTSCR